MKKRRMLFAIVVIVLLAAPPVTYWYLDLGHGMAEPLPDLEGRTFESISNELGRPNVDETFASGDSVARDVMWHRVTHDISIVFEKREGEWIAIQPYRIKRGVAFDRYNMPSSK